MNDRDTAKLQDSLGVVIVAWVLIAVAFGVCVWFGIQP